MSLKHYYNRFKLERRGGKKSHLLSLPVPAAVTTCSRKRGSERYGIKAGVDKVNLLEYCTEVDFFEHLYFT